MIPRVLCSLLIAYFFAPAPVFAAELFLVSTQVPVAGETLVVSLLLDAKGDAINAIEGTLEYPVEHLRLKEIRDGNSIINFWIEKLQDSAGTIRFSGITPGGFSGDRGLIAALEFEVLKTGDVVFNLRDSQALLNDGEGTAVPFSLHDSTSVDAASPEAYQAVDTVPPEAFEIIRAQSEDVLSGKPFIVFATQDKQSGIDHYEVAEKGGIRLDGFMQYFLSFERAESPYELQNDTAAYVYVKAIDKDGNSRISVLSPEKSSPVRTALYVAGILLVLITLLYVRRYVRTVSK